MESAVDEGKVLQLGIANFYRLEDVQWAYEHARIKPKVVQNRFYADSGHDVEIRAFCKENDIEYQSYVFRRITVNMFLRNSHTLRVVVG